MKYNSINKPIQCFMTESTCYQETDKMDIKGVLWHSKNTRNNPVLKRYVQPSGMDENYDELIQKIGENFEKNDWNHTRQNVGVNAWIGKLADGSVATVQTLPWDFSPWGCGFGINGSCNNGWIQFEIEEDDLTDASYFNQVYKEACELTAYLCQLFDINPNGFVKMGDELVPTILCHKDAYNLGVGGNHIDVLHWFPRFEKTMTDVRKDVSILLGITPVEEMIEPEVEEEESFCKVGDILKLKKNAHFISGKSIPLWMMKGTIYAKELLDNGNIVISAKRKGNGLGTISPNQVIEVEEFLVNDEFKVQVRAAALNIRANPSQNSTQTGVILDKGKYVITQKQNNWGKLKNGLGWICLDYTTKL